MSAPSSQSGAAGAGGAQGSAGSGRAIPRTGRFADLSMAHSAIVGRSNPGGHASSCGEAPAVEQDGSSGGSAGRSSPPLSLFLEPMREVSSVYKQSVVLGPADSANNTVGEIVAAYGPTSSVASRSVSQHTATLYKLDPEQARRDGAANHHLEGEGEDDDDDLPEFLQHFRPPRAQLPGTPPAFWRGHRRQHPAVAVAGPSPSSVANSVGLLATTPTAVVPPIPAAFVQVPTRGHGATVDHGVERDSWLSMPGPDVGPSGSARPREEEGPEIETFNDAFIGDSSSSSHGDPFFLEAALENAVSQRLRQAASTTFSQSPDATPAHQRQQPLQQQGQQQQRLPAASPVFSYASPGNQSSTDRILHHAAPHAGTISRPSPPTLGTAVGPACSVFATDQQRLHHAGPPVSRQDHGHASRREQHPDYPTLLPPSSTTLHQRPRRSPGSSPLSIPRRTDGHLKYVFGDDEDDNDQQGIFSRPVEVKNKGKDVDRKGKANEKRSPYERLDGEEDSIYFRRETPEPRLLTRPGPINRRPIVTTLSGSPSSPGSLLSEGSYLPFQLIPLEQAAIQQAERHARGDFSQTIPSSSRQISSSSHLPSDVPGAPLDSLRRFHQQRKPLPLTAIHNPYQRPRAVTQSSRSDDLGPEAIPTSPLSSRAPGPHQRVNSTDLFNGVFDNQGSWHPRASVTMTRGSPIQRLARAAGVPWDGSIELGYLPPLPRPVLAREQWDNVSMEEAPNPHAIRSLAEIIPPPDRRA